jgi:hypothetical protein
MSSTARPGADQSSATRGDDDRSEAGQVPRPSEGATPGEGSSEGRGGARRCAEEGEAPAQEEGSAGSTAGVEEQAEASGLAAFGVGAYPCWFEGTAFATRPFRTERKGDTEPVLSGLRPPPSPGRWKWVGIGQPVEVSEETPEGWRMWGTWLPLPPHYTLGKGLVFADAHATYEVRWEGPTEVRLAITARGERAVQIVSVPRSVVEETLRMLPPPEVN